MTKVVNDNYPTANPISNDELKAKFISESAKENAKVSNTPTEIIELPSKGYFYPEGHPLSAGTIEMKYMTAREEDILASQSLIKQGVVIDKLLNSLIMTKVNYNEILTVDKNAIFIASRILAYGPDYEVEITCPSCGEKTNHHIDLQSFESKDIDWSKFTKGQLTYNFTLPIGKNNLTLKFLTHGDEKEIEESIKIYKKLSKIIGVDAELTTRLKHMIVAVDGNEDKNYINGFVDNMLSRDSLALRSYVKETTPDIDSTFSFTCPHCDYEQEKMAMPITDQFFWPSL